MSVQNSTTATLDTRSSATNRDSTWHVKQPFKVTQGHPLLCQSTQHIWFPI